MIKMADINKRLLTSSDGIPAPQHKVKGESDFEFTEGSGGAQHTKIVDSSGQPISIDEELKSIKRTQAEILDRLDNGIDTRPVESKVENNADEYLLNQQSMINVLSDSTKVFGVYWDKGSDSKLIRTDDSKDFEANVGISGDIVRNDFDNAPIYREIGEVADDYGNVFVKIPKFYIRKKDGKKFKTWQISKTQYAGFYLPCIFYDFKNEKELPYALIGKHEASLSDDNKLESKPNKNPVATKHIVDFRKYAENNGEGYQQNDIHAIDVLQTLFYVEFATLNSQDIMRGWVDGNYSSNHEVTVSKSKSNQAIVSNSTASDYEVGQTIGIGNNHYGNQTTGDSRLITKIDKYDDDNIAITFDGDAVDISKGDVIANRAWLTGFSKDILAASGTLDKDDGWHPIVYRGIENPWGSQYEWIDGINIVDHQVWVAKDARDYKSNVFASPYEKLSYKNAESNGYAKKMGSDANLMFAELPVDSSGSSSTYYADYYYQNPGNRVAAFGGSWSSGSHAGLSFWRLRSSSGNRSAHRGGRLLKKPL